MMNPAQKQMNALRKRTNGLQKCVAMVLAKAMRIPETGKYNVDRNSDCIARSIWRQIHKIMKTEFKDIYFKKRFKKLL
jgi:hypothetical protein